MIGGSEESKPRDPVQFPSHPEQERLFRGLWAGKTKGNLRHVTCPRKTLSAGGRMASEGQILLGKQWCPDQGSPPLQ